MNILVPESWLRQYIKTEASTKEIAEYLSLCSQSVERINVVGEEKVFDIEITTNRPDCFSIYGIARELKAILPRFNFKAQLKELTKEKISYPTTSLPLKIEIEDETLCPRFTALIFDEVTIKASPKVVQERIEKCGIRSLNNVIDISNYLMLELGQPMHTFDYDKILENKMILRTSKKGEKLMTIDHTIKNLPEGTMVIEDGSGRLIDLCGIMGGANSEIDDNTKRVLLFVQTYNPIKIRQTCQLLGFRTEAAARFEKGIDPEGVMIAMEQAISMFKKNCNARIASKLIDIYPSPRKTKKVVLPMEKMDKLLGIKISEKESKEILESLGFVSTISYKPLTISSLVPHWRYDDINIAEDLIEEIARIYGYFNIPIDLNCGEAGFPLEKSPFSWEGKTRDFLSNLGFSETNTYSLISKDLLQIIGLEADDYLQVSNPLSLDQVYLRPTLIPSMLQAIKLNENNESKIEIFEMANIYIPQGKHQLPKEILTLTGLTTGEDLNKLKGLIEVLLEKLGIENYNFNVLVEDNKLFIKAKTAKIFVDRMDLGLIGEINSKILGEFGIKSQVLFFELNFENIVSLANSYKKYQPISTFPPIIEDLSIVFPPKTEIGKVIQSIKEVSPNIKNVNLIDSYKDSKTFRINYQSFDKTLTSEEVEKLRKEILSIIEKNYKGKLKVN